MEIVKILPIPKIAGCFGYRRDELLSDAQSIKKACFKAAPFANDMGQTVTMEMKNA